MHRSTLAKYAKRIGEVDTERMKKGFPSLQHVWHLWNPACKMRVVGKDLKGFTARFVINQINIEEGHALTTKSSFNVEA